MGHWALTAQESHFLEGRALGLERVKKTTGTLTEGHSCEDVWVIGCLCADATGGLILGWQEPSSPLSGFQLHIPAPLLDFPTMLIYRCPSGPQYLLSFLDALLLGRPSAPMALSAVDTLRSLSPPLNLSSEAQKPRYPPLGVPQHPH